MDDCNGSSILVHICIPNSTEIIQWRMETHFNVPYIDLLDMLSEICGGSKVVACQYIDNDGDKITVDSEEELQVMCNYFVSQAASGCVPSLYPVRGDSRLRLGGAAQHDPAAVGSRNIHGLTVVADTEQREPLCEPEPTQREPAVASVRRDCSRELTHLLLTNDGGTMNSHNLRLIQQLGSGNSGTVYKAYYRDDASSSSDSDSGADVTVAVKQIALDVSEESRRQIMSELQILHQCISDTIIHFYTAFYTNSCFYMCTEYMDGGSLDSYIGHIDSEEVLAQIAVPVVKGLNYLWSMKIMHRDVKPSNILLNTSGYVKLCDFGVSIQLVNSIANTYIGTNAYMAPERIQGEEYGIQSDVWSVGITITEMALGRFPYTPASSPIELLQYIVHDQAPALSRDRFSSGLIQLCSKCLQKVPQERPTPEQLMSEEFIRQHSAVGAGGEGRRILRAWIRDLQHQHQH